MTKAMFVIESCEKILLLPNVETSCLRRLLSLKNFLKHKLQLGLEAATVNFSKWERFQIEISHMILIYKVKLPRKKYL